MGERPEARDLKDIERATQDGETINPYEQMLLDAKQEARAKRGDVLSDGTGRNMVDGEFDEEKDRAMAERVEFGMDHAIKNEDKAVKARVDQQLANERGDAFWADEHKKDARAAEDRAEGGFDRARANANEEARQIDESRRREEQSERDMRRLGL